MSAPAHTPGPLSFRALKHGGVYQGTGIFAAGGAVQIGETFGKGIVEDEANARLFAAAPDTAEQCDALLDLLIEALPCVEGALDDPCEKPSGHAKTRGLVQRIRKATTKEEPRA